MDPYLERYWSDVHVSLVGEARNALNSILPEDLIARSERHLTIDGDDDGEAGDEERVGPSKIIPDVGVFEVAGDLTGEDAGGVGVATLAPPTALGPMKIRTNAVPMRRRFIQILDLGGRLVTVIEFVSPGNKHGRGRREFLRERRKLIAAGVNAVEIDLTRGGGDWRRLYRFDIDDNAAHRAVIFAAARVAERRPSIWVHPMPLMAPLPTVKIPLRPKDAPAELVLQPLVDAAYRNGRYGRTIRYDQPCLPPLPKGVTVPQEA